MLLLLLVLPLYMFLILISLKIVFPIIKKMENMNELLNHILPAQLTTNECTSKEEPTTMKREYLKNLVEEGKANLIPGLEALNFEKASEKNINHFYNLVANPSYVTNRFASYALGVDDVQKMMNDINAHPLMEKSCSSLMSYFGGGIRSPMEGIGVYAYENYSMVLTPLMFLSQVFIHLDWKRFALIAEQRRREAKKQAPENAVAPPLIIINDDATAATGDNKKCNEN